MKTKKTKALRALARRVCGTVAVRAFNNNFEIVVAHTQALKEESYRLRRQIFCEERGFDLPCENGMERDEYDHRSLPFLIKYKIDGVYIGTGRIILPCAEDPLHSFPLQGYLNEAAVSRFKLDNITEINSTCEISRLGVLKKYSRYKNGKYKKKPCFSSFLLGKKIPDLGKLGLYRAIFLLALNHSNTPNCIFSTDPWLLTKFRKAGFGAHTVMGDDIDIFGTVTPVHFNVNEMMAHAYARAPENWMIISDNGKIGEKMKPERLMRKPFGENIQNFFPRLRHLHEIRQQR